MRKAAFAALMLFFSVILHSYAQAQGDPMTPPAFPREPPPPAKSSASGLAQPLKGGEKPVRFTYDLKKGWNLVSFPFSRILCTWGFSFKLLRYEAGTYYAVDPAAETAQIDTRWGYLVYADKDRKAWAEGLPNKGEVRTADFNGGWNLAGCPSLAPPPWSRMTASLGSTTHRVLDVAGPPQDNKNHWISSKVYLYDQKLIPADIAGGADVRKPGRGLWFYAWQPLSITIVQDARNQGYPEITSVIPASAAIGQAVTISGSGFGSEPDLLSLAGITLSGVSIRSWAPGRIVFTVPSFAVTGELVAYNDRKPSNAVELAVKEGSLPTRGATLQGKVQDGNKASVRGAFVSLGQGLSAYTGEDGAFSLVHVPAGEQLIQVSRAGYKTSKGKVTIPESGTKTVLLSLPAEKLKTGPPVTFDTPARPGKEASKKMETGTLYAVASAGTVDGKRWWVYRIEVSEWGNSNYSWHNTWYSDYGDTLYELKCPGARIGQTYNFRIEWRRKSDNHSYSYTWSRKMYKDWQKERFDRPW